MRMCIYRHKQFTSANVGVKIVGAEQSRVHLTAKMRDFKLYLMGRPSVGGSLVVATSLEGHGRTTRPFVAYAAANGEIADSCGRWFMATRSRG